jgi:hypothetical protein
MKSRYLPGDFPRRAEQQLFDQKLTKIIQIEDDRHGPDANELRMTLDAYGLEIRGFRLQRKRGARATGAPKGAAEPARVLGGTAPESPRTGYDSETLVPHKVSPTHSVLTLLNEENARRSAGMTVIKAIITVLGKSDRPLNAVEIHQAISKEGLFEFKAKDPKGVISSTIGKHLRSAGTRALEKAGAGTFKSI